MFRLRIVLLSSGAGSLAQAIFDADLNLEILALISDKDSQALKRAERSGIKAIYLPLEEPREDWNKKLFEKVKDLNPDLVVSVGFMRILDKEFVEKFRTINTHPALLPNFPGAHAVRDALAAKVSESGCTLHYVDEGVDTGPIIAQRRLAILPNESESSLHERIKVLERELIITGILQLLEEEQ